MNWKTSVPLLLFAALGVAPTAPAAASVVWFTDVQPEPAAAHGEHNHGGPVERGRGGVVHKRIYMRYGEHPGEAEYAHGPAEPGTIHVSDPTGTLSSMPFGPEQHGTLAFPMPHEGFYNVYMTSRRLEGRELRVSVTKAELLRHSCREGHDHVAEAMPYRSWSEAPIEIVRERLPDENFHTLPSSGDDVTFRVLVDGRPAAGASVRMHTQQGWTKAATADADGRATFQLIRDYYPPWHEFQRRYQESFLTIAEYVTEMPGTHDGQPYDRIRFVTTLPGSYHPSARDYASYGYGLGIGLLGLVLTGGGAVWYRRRGGVSR